MSEDVGLGFAVHAMQLLGAIPCITKWELGQRDRRSLLVSMLRAAGVHQKVAAGAVQSVLSGIKGADFVSYSPVLGKWVVCESKGSMSEPPDPADIARVLAAPSAPPIGRKGSAIQSVPEFHKAVKQKLDTAKDLSGAVPGGVISIAVITSLGTEGNGRWTTVDYIDPPADGEAEAAFALVAGPLRSLIASTHFEWVASVFGLEENPWGHQLDVGSAALQVDVQVPAAEVPFLIRLALDATLLPVLASGTVEELDAYVRQHPQHPDGVLARLLEGPEPQDGPDTARGTSSLTR